MAFKLKGSRPRLAILLVVLLLIGGWMLFRPEPIRKIDHPEYLTFSGQYVFSVPKDKAVDAHAIQGLQIVHSGKIAGKTIDEVYADNNISLQPVEFLKDKKANDFKKYINETLVPEQKQKLSPDVTATFEKSNGWDVAKVTVKKDGQPLRFIYIKNSLHPVSIVSKEETEAFKKIEQSVTDVERTDLKNEAEKLKQAAQTTAQQIKDKKAKELYASAALELKTKNSEAQITDLLAAEEVYSQGMIIINGGSYSSGEFGVVIYFIPLNKDFKPASGALYFKKVDRQWKLSGLQLPNPLSNKIEQ
ncbi:MAG TPA: hypothetical protein VJY84_01575 [Candidatus Saccharimonadales bacterium]|nr:hypothetical protein [Candidatus Saccharimonadales bacterium]